jgi:hypothetical protein
MMYVSIIIIEPDVSIFTGEYEQKEGFGKCYICGVHSTIKYTVNSKGQVIEETKECSECVDEWQQVIG